jgi:hypothetical protein
VLRFRCSLRLHGRRLPLLFARARGGRDGRRRLLRLLHRGGSLFGRTALPLQLALSRLRLLLPVLLLLLQESRCCSRTARLCVGGSSVGGARVHLALSSS